MIYEYEACVLRHINRACPEVKEATYAKDISMFGAMAPKLEYPSVLYTRPEVNWDFPAIHTVNNGVPEYYAPFEQTYIARVYFATQADALRFAGMLKLFWRTHAYVQVPVADFLVPVGLRLLYIKVDEDRPGNDKAGPQRYAELSWKSRLFFYESENKEEYLKRLVQEVRIYVTEDETLVFKVVNGQKVLNKDNLIAVIK